MVDIVGHRGAAGLAPENTLLAFNKAIEVGCTRVELDARLSKDGVPIVMHDSTVERTTGGTGRVDQLTITEIKKLRCRAAQEVPTLREAIDACKRKIDMQIELKVRKVAGPAAELVRRLRMIRHVLFTSFDHDTLRRVKVIARRASVGLLTREFSDKVVKRARAIRAEVLGMPASKMTGRIVDLIHKNDLKAYAYRTMSSAQGIFLADIGVDALGSDLPNELTANTACMRL